MIEFLHLCVYLQYQNQLANIIAKFSIIQVELT